MNGVVAENGEVFSLSGSADWQWTHRRALGAALPMMIGIGVCSIDYVRSASTVEQ